MKSPFRRVFRRIIARPSLAVSLVGLLAFCVGETLSFLRPPLPRVHDEASYLLASDTFASGRWTNPRHPLWPYFETFHVLHEPTYASKYPPLPGFFLALGQIVTGAPIVGAWIGVALGCAGVCWMLYGVTRPRWAFLGGILAALHHGIHGGIPGWGSCYSWSQSFWGGGPAMLGGALVLGGWARWRRRADVRIALSISLGAVILAGTRPFEGLLVCFPVILGMIRRGFRAGEPGVACLVTMLVVLGPSAALMARYNHEVTGSALSLPYSIYESTYNPAPIFAVFQSPKPMPGYRHAELKRFFEDWCTGQIDRQRIPGGWWAYHRERLGWMRAFFVGPLLFPLLALPWSLQGRRCREALGLIGVVVGVHLLTVGIQPHYAAPVAGCFFLLVVEGMRRLATISVRRVHYGVMFNRLTCLFVVLNLVMVAVERVKEPPGWESARAGMERSLLAKGGRHVVVVRYTPEHDLLHEWVTNRADIDAAGVVWAREMSDMQSLRRHFEDRTFWLTDADARVPTLKAFPGKP